MQKIIGQIFSLIVLLKLFIPLQLLGMGWSIPTPLNPNSSYLTTPFTATSANGNSIVIWYNNEGRDNGYGSLQGAFLHHRNIRKDKLIWTFTTPIVQDNAQLPFSSIAQAVGMDSLGNCLVAWADNNNRIRSAYLKDGSFVWTHFPLSLNQSTGNVNPPYVTVSTKGDAVVLWTSMTENYHFHLHANVFDAKKKQWRGDQEILHNSLNSTSTINQINIDQMGNAVVVVTTASNSIQTVRYHFESNLWEEIQPILLDSSIEQTQASVAMSTDNKALIIWVSNDNSAFTATLKSNQTKFDKKILLSDSANNLFSFPVIKTDRNGNGIAVWAENLKGLGTARFSPTDNSWVILPFLDLENKIPINISLAVDEEGNAIASWAIFSYKGGIIQTAILPKDGGKWNLLKTMTLNTNQNQNPQSLITAKGHALTLWENDSGPFFSGTINSSIYYKLFPLLLPSPPENLNGTVEKKKGKKSRILTWEASKDPSVKQYKIYRDGTFLDVIKKPPYLYKDKTRKHKETYFVTSVDKEGFESNPVSLTLK